MHAQSFPVGLDLSLNLFKGRDNADNSLHGYKVFKNPSISDVPCTTTAEALAMGKFVTCAEHPSNEFLRSYRELIDLMAKHKIDLEGFKLDVYGSGEDSQEVQSTAKRCKVFKNPSISDVLCTTTAEALAMGKFVICAEHPSNEFFMSFPNCLTYKTSEEFVARVKEAMDREPQPLTPEQRYNLSREAATERFMEYSDLEKVLNNEAAQSEQGRKRKNKRTSQPNLSSVFRAHLREIKHNCCCGSPQPSSCRTRRVRRWTSTSPGSARPRTGSSLLRIMRLSRSTLATWMRMACTMSLHHVCSLWVCPCSGYSPGVMLTARWTGRGRRRLRSSSRSCT
ncbi:Digalactosyldiacylglycerol synthase 1 chloroplastic [Zea mays]|uniref:Digalactosyldiacylglycerol synthase 1 chloroplastic n=1 Tax=Zea mays TaxID=4577 RepID=A0A1D6ERF1_MAIZE|nr:Digalactosyldiacylglycerol synthase 1 chloroplastic [Zea mays]